MWYGVVWSNGVVLLGYVFVLVKVWVMADTSSKVQFLLQTTLGGVCALHMFMAYMDNCTYKDKDVRGNQFVSFVKWANDTNSLLDYSVLTKYADYLKFRGGKEKTVGVVISHIRQFLKAAESVSLINKCVYTKRGRSRKAVTIARINPKTKQIIDPVLESIQNQNPPKKKRGRPRKNKVIEQVVNETVEETNLNLTSQIENVFKKSFLYDLFQITSAFTEDELKRSFRRMAMFFHPDRDCGSQERFLACKEVYEYLQNTVNKVTYDFYIQEADNLDFSSVDEFVHSIYQRIGGYLVLNSL